MKARLGADLRRVHTLFTSNDISMKCVLDERAPTLRACSPDARRVGLVVGEQHLAVCVSV